jgi:hypothetical protein
LVVIPAVVLHVLAVLVAQFTWSSHATQTPLVAITVNSQQQASMNCVGTEKRTKDEKKVSQKLEGAGKTIKQ